MSGALGDLGAERRILGGRLEEVDDLGELELGAVAAGDVLERDARVGLHLDLRLRLADAAGAAHRPAAHAARPAARREEVEADEEEEREEVDEERAEVAEERERRVRLGR